MIKTYNNTRDFKNKFKDLLADKPLDLIQFIRNLTIEINGKVFLGAVFNEKKPILLFFNTMPFNLQLYSISTDLNEIKNAIDELVIFIHTYQKSINGIAGTSLVTNLFIESSKKLGFTFELQTAMDIMVLEELKTNLKIDYTIATEKNTDELAKAIKLFYLEAMHQVPTDASVQGIIKASLENKNMYLVLNENDEIIATTRVSLIGNIYNVAFVYTNPEYRNKGYAKKLVTTVIDSLQHKFDKFSLFVDKANPISNKIYLEIGFDYFIDNYAYKLII